MEFYLRFNPSLLELTVKSNQTIPKQRQYLYLRHIQFEFLAGQLGIQEQFFQHISQFFQAVVCRLQIPVLLNSVVTFLCKLDIARRSCKGRPDIMGQAGDILLHHPLRILLPLLSLEPILYKLIQPPA